MNVYILHALIPNIFDPPTSKITAIFQTNSLVPKNILLIYLMRVIYALKLTLL